MSTLTTEQTGLGSAVRPVPEMRAYLADWREQATAKRSWLEVISVEAAQDIHSDIERDQREACATVYGEEQRNLLNAQEIDEIRADGVVSPDEFARLGRLASRERRSAAALHGVTEVLA